MEKLSAESIFANVLSVIFEAYRRRRGISQFTGIAVGKLCHGEKYAALSSVHAQHIVNSCPTAFEQNVQAFLVRCIAARA